MTQNTQNNADFYLINNYLRFSFYSYHSLSVIAGLTRNLILNYIPVISMRWRIKSAKTRESGCGLPSVRVPDICGLRTYRAGTKRLWLTEAQDGFLFCHFQ